MALTTVQQVQAAYKAINRVDLNETAAAAVATAIDNGVTTITAYSQGLIAQSATTTQAAFALSTFIEGAVPTSARIDSLTAFAKAQNDYYTNTLKSANANIGAYEALGKAFAADASTSAAFAARYGALSATDFVTAAYAQVFDKAGSVPSAAALNNLVSQVAYFTDLYTNAGIPAADAALQAKGAVLGQIIGYAFTDATRAADSSLQDRLVSDVAPPSNSAMNQIVTEALAETTPSTVYGASVLGNTVTIGAPADVVSPTAAAGLKTTVYGDTINGTAGVTMDDTTKVDGGQGIDTFVVTTAGAYAPAAGNVKNIEQLKVVSTNAAASVDVTNITGLTKVTFDAASNNGAAIIGLDTSTEVHVTETGAFGLALGYKSAPAAAKVSIDANYTGAISFNDAAVKAVTADVTAASSSVLFNDAQLETVTVTSKGDVTLGTIGAGLKTLDLSGVGTFAKADLSANAFTNAVTVTASKGADIVEINANLGHKVTLGAGADTIEFNVGGNVTAATIATATTLAAAVTSVTDFKVSDGDILRLNDLIAPPVAPDTVRTALDATALGQINASTDIKAAATLAGTFTDAVANPSWAIFNFGGDAYALFDSANDGFGAGDTLIKVTGIQVADLTATNLIFV